MEIKIQIDRCDKCPYFIKNNPYSTDGFDYMEDWVCTKAEKKIQGAVEWHEVRKIDIPEWCPAKA